MDIDSLCCCGVDSVLCLNGTSENDRGRRKRRGRGRSRTPRENVNASFDERSVTSKGSSGYSRASKGDVRDAEDADHVYSSRIPAPGVAAAECTEYAWGKALRFDKALKNQGGETAESVQSILKALEEDDEFNEIRAPMHHDNRGSSEAARDIGTGESVHVKPKGHTIQETCETLTTNSVKTEVVQRKASDSRSGLPLGNRRLERRLKSEGNRVKGSQLECDDLIKISPFANLKPFKERRARSRRLRFRFRLR